MTNKVKILLKEKHELRLANNTFKTNIRKEFKQLNFSIQIVCGNNKSECGKNSK